MKGVSILSRVFRSREDQIGRDTRQNYRVLLLLLSVSWIILQASIQYYVVRITVAPWVVISVPLVHFGLFLLTFRGVPLRGQGFLNWLYGGFFLTVGVLLYLIARWDTNYVLLFGLGTFVLITSIFFESRRAYFLYIGTILPVLFAILVYLYGDVWQEILYPFLVMCVVSGAGLLYLHLKFQARSQLREKDDLLRSFYQYADVAIVITTPQGTTMDLNEKACQLFRGTAQTLAGYPMQEALRESYSAQAFGRILRTVVDKGYWHDKVEFCNTDSEIFWAEVSIRRFKVNRDVLLYFTIANITGQLMDRVALRERELQYRLLMEEASDGILLLDAQGKLLEGNQQAGNLLQSSVQDLVGESLYSLLDPQEQLKDPLKLEELISGGNGLVERTFVLPNGESTTLEFSLKGVPGDYLMMMFRDVSGRKASQQALVTSEQRFRALIEYSHDVVIIVDASFRIQYLSPSFQRRLQIAPEKVLGTSLVTLVEEPHREVLQAQLEAVSKSPAQQEEVKNLEIKSGDDVSYFFEAMVTNLLNEPEVEGLVVNLHDVSRRLRTERQLDQVNFELDSFIYKSSHDIRAPLMSILGLVNLARKATAAELPRYFDLMEKGVHRMDTFIRDLTHFSRNDRMKVERKAINFHQLVQEIVGNLRHMQNLEKVRVTVDMKSQEAFFSDPMRVSIVLSNLISNAVKYHDVNKYNPYVRLEIHVSPAQAIVRVQDNGTGIEAPYLDKIFEMFYRATELSDGSGLGLYVAQSIVKKLSGTLTVQSEFRQGTTFTLTLPNMKPSRAEQLLADDPEEEVEEEEEEGKVIPLNHRSQGG